MTEELKNAIEIIKDLLDQFGALEECDCGGSSLCSVCKAQSFLEYYKD